MPCGNQYVILVDQAESAEGSRIVRTMWVDPHLPAPGRFQVVIQRSPELRAFVRCDVQVPDPNLQNVLTILCADTLGQ
jgi:hypothetical protein